MLCREGHLSAEMIRMSPLKRVGRWERLGATPRDISWWGQALHNTKLQLKAQTNKVQHHRGTWTSDAGGGERGGLLIGNVFAFQNGALPV